MAQPSAPNTNPPLTRVVSVLLCIEAMNPLEDVSMLAVATMLVYITLSVFTILNVVTGVFVNTAPSWQRQSCFACLGHSSAN